MTLLYFWLKSPQQAIERVAERVATGGRDQETTIKDNEHFKIIEEYVKR